MIYSQQALETIANRADTSNAEDYSTGERQIVECLIAIAERLPRDTELKERLRAIVANCKCSDYKSPSELEAAVMALADELEGD